MKSALISLSMKLKQERYYSYSRSNVIIHLQDHYHCFFHSNKKKLVLNHNNFSSSKTSSRHLQDVSEDEKLLH